MKLMELFVALGATRSRLEKEKLLREYPGDVKILKEFIQYVLDYKRMYGVKKFTRTTNEGFEDFESHWEDIKEVLDKLISRELTGNEAREQLEYISSYLDDDGNILLQKIIDKDLRVGVAASTVNKVFPDLVKEFEVQLAHPYEKNRKYDTTIWFASRKLDGIRCFFDPKLGLMTRGGKQFFGFDHIEKEMRVICEKYDLEFMDGEIYSHSIPFERIQGIALSSVNINDEEKRTLKFHCFAIGKSDFEVTRQMVDLMEDIKSKESLEYIYFLDYDKIDNTFDAIDKITDQYLSEGYEGAVLRDPIEYYVYGRSHNLVKVKKMVETNVVDITVVCVGANEGNGKYVGMVGSLQCEGFYVDNEGNKIEIKVNVSGLKDWQRKEYWDNLEYYKGKELVVAFQNITGSGNSIRFGQFKGWKLDR